MEDIYTGSETDRQDCVDNAIYNLLLELSPTDDEDILEWDIEEIADIRDMIEEILVNKHKLMSSYEFYPYRVIQSDEIAKPESFIISDKYGKISHLVEDSVAGLDAQEFADLVGELFGGTCRYIEEYKFSFTPNSDYQGGLDDIKED